MSAVDDAIVAMTRDLHTLERNRRWTQLSAVHHLTGVQWAEVKKHVEWLYRRIKVLEQQATPGESQP